MTKVTINFHSPKQGEEFLTWFRNSGTEDYLNWLDIMEHNPCDVTIDYKNNLIGIK